ERERETYEVTSSSSVSENTRAIKLVRLKVGIYIRRKERMHHEIIASSSEHTCE
ncbi:29257_t:CDS:2, partial [Gigaspora margarita]